MSKKMSSIGKLERVELRQVWPNEARDFTVWLQKNIEILNEALGITLIDVKSECSVGRFRVDLKAKTEAGDIVVIENQLKKSNHKHLGQLITYFTSTSAKIAIWIVKEAELEHAKAIEWLNSPTSKDAKFYLVKVEAVKIGDSAPAPIFTLIAGSSVVMKEIFHTKSAKRERAERHDLRELWAKHLIEKSKIVGALHGKAKANITTNLVCRIVTGVELVHKILENRRAVELDFCSKNRERNLKMFHIIAAQKEKVEQSFGAPLVWDDGNKGCKIIFFLEGGGYRSPEEQWSDLQDEAVLVMQRFTKALTPYFSEVGIAPSL